MNRRDFIKTFGASVAAATALAPFAVAEIPEHLDVASHEPFLELLSVDAFGHGKEHRLARLEVLNSAGLTLYRFIVSTCGSFTFVSPPEMRAYGRGFSIRCDDPAVSWAMLCRQGSKVLVAAHSGEADHIFATLPFTPPRFV